MLVHARSALSLGAVLNAVPQLRSVLFRELSSSASVLNGGKIQKPPISARAGIKARRADGGPVSYGSRYGPGPPSASDDRSRGPRRAGYGGSTPDRHLGATERRFGQDRRDEGDWRRGSAAGPARQTATTSRRLAQLDVPPRRSSSRNSTQREVPQLGGQTLDPPTASHAAASAAASVPQRFASYDLAPALQESLKGLYGSSAKTTPIQSLALGRLLGDSTRRVSAILGAETGSGKTLAYLLPMLHHLKATDRYTPPESEASRALDTAPDFLRPESTHNPHGPLAPRGLVLSPTHELTRQITAVVKSLCHALKLSSVGGSSTKGPVTKEGDVDVFAATGGTVRRMLRLKGDGEEIEEWDAKARRERQQAEDEHEGEDVHVLREHERDAVDEADGPNLVRESKLRLRLDRVEWVVIDEADIMLGPDHLNETLGMLKTVPTGASILLTTATLPPSLLHAVTQPPLNTRKFMQLISPGMHKLPKGLTTTFVTRGETGGNMLTDVVKRIQRAFADDALEASLARRGQTHSAQQASASTITKTKAIVFCNADNKVKRTGEVMLDKGLRPLVWTGDSDDRIRGTNGPLSQFLSRPTPLASALRPPQSPLTTTATIGATPTKAAAAASGAEEPRVLVTTSLLSRGLDFSPLVSTIVLLEPPRDTLDFIHRAGRAGRAGRKGRVIVYGMGEGRSGSLGRTSSRFGMRSGSGSTKGREGVKVEDVVRGRRAPKTDKRFGR